jgi:hypothetical protein
MWPTVRRVGDGGGQDGVRYLLVTEREVRAVTVIAYGLQMSDHGPVEPFPSAPFVEVLAAGAHKAMSGFIIGEAGAMRQPRGRHSQIRRDEGVPTNSALRLLARTQPISTSVIAPAVSCRACVFYWHAVIIALVYII